ncbi:MAG: RIP metalloprotease RseP, partial [Thermoanaerobaculia bacterium]|nr:RIP metalloprotease RseP [Thermoanaerobaculia bacterium]
DEERTGADDEYLSKPKWQRFLILMAGPAANLVLAVLFLALFFMGGTEELRDREPMIGSVVEDMPAEEAGLRPGDRIVSVNGKPIQEWEDLRMTVGLNAETPVELVIGRDGERIETTIVPNRVMTPYGSTGQIGVTQWLPTEVGRVMPGTAAARAGLRSGDVIVRAGGEPVAQMRDLDAHLEDESKPVDLVVLRNGREVEITLPARLEDESSWPGFGLPTTIHEYTWPEAFDESLRQNWRMTKFIFYTIGRLFRFQGSVDDFQGPISIARISGEMLRSGWSAMIYLLAVISLNLGILNLLPIPVLDGGHIAILGIEGIMRRELSPNAKERIYQLGFAFIALLMIVVIWNDVVQNITLMRQ